MFDSLALLTRHNIKFTITSEQLSLNFTQICKSNTLTLNKFSFLSNISTRKLTFLFTEPSCDSRDKPQSF